jgi:hypothetical protein
MSAADCVMVGDEEADLHEKHNHSECMPATAPAL